MKYNLFCLMQNPGVPSQGCIKSCRTKDEELRVEKTAPDSDRTTSITARHAHFLILFVFRSISHGVTRFYVKRGASICSAYIECKKGEQTIGGQDGDYRENSP